MNIQQFWSLVEQSRSDFRPDHPDGNMDRQAENLARLLSDLEPDEVREFDDQMNSFQIEAYTWDLWGAAALLAEGSCSDDFFADFRSWLISMGRSTFEAAIADPQSLAVPAFAPGVEDIFFEEFQYVPSQVFEEMTAQEITEYTRSHPDQPSGVKWWNKSEDLKARYPVLWQSVNRNRRDP
jgi:hypothetical protein